jgi:23S rRNA (uracil1939-C5)-methyltransferase
MLSQPVRKKGTLWAEIEKIIEPSPHRVSPACPYFGKCGGCNWLHFAYPAQGEWKTRLVEEALRRMAGVECAVEFREDATLRTAYRTRAEYHTFSGRVGFFARNSHRVVEIAQCPLCHPALNEAAGLLRGMLTEGSCELTVNPAGDDVLAWFPRASRMRPRWRQAFPQGFREADSGPRPCFTHDGVSVVCGGFTQASLLLNSLLRDTVRECAEGAATIFDAFCGSGNLSAPFAREGRTVLGMDHNRAAVAAANTVLPDGTASYEVGDETEMADAIRERAWDAIILDPPRTGARLLATALADANAKRIVYVSCDPATLARDIKVIASGGWMVSRVIALDLFPNTAHVETVAVLTREEVAANA